MIKFSIITVCLNAGEDLLFTVDNILKQEYQNFELIIKDGFSTDGSVDNLPVDERIAFVQRKDTSVYDAMNQAIEYATGDFCIFINAGDGLYDKNTLNEIANFIDFHEGDFYYGKSYTVSSGVTNYAPAKIDKYFCYRSTMCHQAMVIRTSFLKERGYDISYKIAADREWMVYACICAKMKFVRMPTTVSLYKGGGISSNEKAKSYIKDEDERIKQTYFTKSERFKFGLKYMTTFPKLRSWIVKNPKLKKMYYSVRYKYLSK